MNLNTGWEYAGKFGIDSGLTWIGDPCYIAENDGLGGVLPSPSIKQIVREVGDQYITQHNRFNGFPYGVSTRNFYGDTEALVYVKHNEQGGVIAVLVSYEEELDTQIGKGQGQE